MACGVAGSVDETIDKAWIGGGEVGEGENGSGVRGGGDAAVLGEAGESKKGIGFGEAIVGVQSEVRFGEDEVGYVKGGVEFFLLLDELSSGSELIDGLSDEESEKNRGIEAKAGISHCLRQRRLPRPNFGKWRSEFR